jgi:hypothetical protein
VHFRDILQDVLHATHGAIGATFLDSEGETVEVVTVRPFDIGDHDMRVIGAYAGIFFSQLRRIAEAIDGGAVRQFKFDFAASTIFCCDLNGDYYLVLVVDADTVEGTAWQALEQCRTALRGEIL